MSERLLVAAAVVLAAVCEILDVSCRYIRGRFRPADRPGGEKNRLRQHPPTEFSRWGENK